MQKLIFKNWVTRGDVTKSVNIREVHSIYSLVNVHILNCSHFTVTLNAKQIALTTQNEYCTLYNKRFLIVNFCSILHSSEKCWNRRKGKFNRKSTATRRQFQKLCDSPFSCRLRFLLLQILTAQTDRMMATMKNKNPPTTPAFMALCFTLAGTGNLTSSELS